MTEFPDKIHFKEGNLVAELEIIISKDSKGVKLKEQRGRYIYLDNGERWQGKISKTYHIPVKVGLKLDLTLDQIEIMIKNEIIKILN